MGKKFVDVRHVMSESAIPAMLEFLSWIASRRRTYAEALEAWQSTCPRHTIWEDALIDGLVQFNVAESGREPDVTVTTRGMALLNGKNNNR
jgi:hypothetical protein